MTEREELLRRLERVKALAARGVGGEKETAEAEETVEAEETAEAEETVEVEETIEAEDPKEDDLAHFEPLDGKGKFDLSDIFAKDDEDKDDKDYGSVFNRLFDEAKDFDSDEKKEGDK